MLDRMFMGAAADDKLFVEDVFSTYLYTGTGAAQTITNGIDLAGKGGLVWVKSRTTGSSHYLYDTARGAQKVLRTNSTAVQGDDASGGATAGLYAFNSNGFSLGADKSGEPNQNGSSLASWTFREAPKFFDIVTYTGNGGDLTINHSLGVQPGCIIIKKYSASGDWLVSHRYNFGGAMLKLNTYDAPFSAGIIATATTFRVFGGAAGNSDIDATYVAYLFAHDATSDGIIQCGSYTETGSAVTVNLGWEPQWLMVKRTDSTGNWVIIDNMRALNMSTTNGAVLFPNTSGAETNDPYWHPTATGFVADPYWGSGASVVYIAIRRGPMRTPTLGTSVFNPITYTGNNTNGRVFSYANTPQIDLSITLNRFSYFGIPETIAWMDRLRGNGKWLNTQAANAESSIGLHFWQNSSTYQQSSNNPQTYNRNSNGDTFVGYGLTRAPKFFDVVCYTGGAGAAEHKLGVSVELIIAKNRTSSSDWAVWHTLFGQSSVKNLFLNTDAAAVTPAYVYLASASNTSHFWTSGSFNTAGQNYVAYLFASCAGVSKVGSYTGNGSSQTINCAFAAGARFVMIKRTDSTGDWYVWDTARGIVAGNDPALLLNLPSEYTGIDSVDPTAVGFIVNQDGTTNVNVNAATYIYLAIA